MSAELSPALRLDLEDVLGNMQHARRTSDLGRLALLAYWDVRKWARRAQGTIIAPCHFLSSPMKDIRYIVLHRPGPAWFPGRSMFEQPGVARHVEHYRQWLSAGKLELGGPHLDAAGGGMMIPVAGVSEEDVRRFAAEDPAVQDGTLLAEVRPWLIGMAR